MSWVIVGLGNPGEEYTQTRHNTGRMALEFFAKQCGVSAWKEDKKSNSLTTGASVGKNMLALVLPNTFMNKSGAALIKFVKSVKATARPLRTNRFVRIRIGVSPATATGKLKKPVGEKEVVDFILTRCKAHELDELKKVFKKASLAIETIVSEGREIAMNRFNS